MGRRDAGFETATRQIGDLLVVSLSGELDMGSAPEFEEAVEDAQGGAAIVVDLRELTFIDSTGIKALLGIHFAGQNGHPSVSFVRGQDPVQRVLQLAGVDQLLAWTDAPAGSVTEAN
jgi:anti-sigma B factor antagonist